MTNEEARELLQLDRKAYTIASPLELCLRTSQHVLFDNEEDKLREAIEMAIKALEQEPCTDTISRQAAIDAFGLSEKTRKYGGDHSGYNTVMLYEIQDVIEDLPSVSTEKTGRWIGHREHCENLGVMPSGLGSYEWCSNCDCGIDVREWHRNNYNYCPNCGAKMEVQDADSD